MKKLLEHIESHFLYTKQQRNGILLLLSLIFTIQLIYCAIDFRVDALDSFDEREVHAFQKQIDSLKQLAIERSKPKVYPFNPNFISDYKGYQLGMSTAEIDRLHAFRKKNKYVNSAKDFQKVTKVSDSLLQKIEPYLVSIRRSCILVVKLLGVAYVKSDLKLKSLHEIPASNLGTNFNENYI